MADKPEQKDRPESWEIVDGKMPDDLHKRLEAVVDEHSRKAYPDPMVAPWFEYPNYERTSMGWRMGGGEDYKIAFQNWLAALSEGELVRYKNENEEPDGWQGFYQDIMP